MVLIPQFEKPHRKKRKYMVTRLHIFPAYEKQQATALLRVYRYNDIIRYNNKFNNNKIEDIRFDGEACAICTSSTSIMIDTLKGKTINEAKEIINLNEKRQSAALI